MRYELPRPNPNPTKFDIKPLYGLDPAEVDAMKGRMKWGDAAIAVQDAAGH